MLYPKRIKLCKYQKGRFKGCKVDSTQLCFGKYGMKSCKVGCISYQAIEVVCCVISKEFRRNGQIWVRVFANIPITSKARMGKGKGNSTSWIACVVEGQILFEMDGVSLSNVQKATALTTHELCLLTKFI
jgi:ribosomal protein L16